MRNITLTDFAFPASTKFAHVLLMSDDDCLYVVLVYKCTSSSSNDYVVGNAAQESFSVTVDNPDHSRVVCLVLVLLVVMSVVLLSYRRRRKSMLMNGAGSTWGRDTAPFPLPPPEGGEGARERKKTLPSSTANLEDEAGKIEQESSLSCAPSSPRKN